MTRRVIVCDVNETLLDVGALGPVFEELFGERELLREWFTTVLLYSEVATLAGPYHDFGAIGGAALDMLAAARGTRLPPDARTRLAAGIRSLPAHHDVAGGLQIMRDAGLRIVTLTNSPPAVVNEQLARTGLARFFEQSFSVDAVRRFKPAPEPYQAVATELRVPIDRLRLIAAHPWDIIGAMRAGCAAAFVARPGKALYPLAPPPDVVGAGFEEVAHRIVAIDAG